MDGHCPWKPQLYSSLSRNEPYELHVAHVRPPYNQIQTICAAPCKTHAKIRCTCASVEQAPYKNFVRKAPDPYEKSRLVQCVLVIRESFTKEYGSRVFLSSPCGPLFLHIEPNQLSLVTRTHCISLYPIVFKQIQDLPGTWSKSTPNNVGCERPANRLRAQRVRL